MNETKIKNEQLVGGDVFATPDKEPIREPFFTVPSKVFEFGINPYELSALFYLCMRADNKTHSCYPSEKGIARACGMSDRTVRNALHHLKDKGLIKIEPHFVKSKNGSNRQTANIYTVTLYADNEAKKVEAHCATDMGSLCPAPRNVTPPPVAPNSEEINKTKHIETKSNITKSNELTMLEAEAVLKERNDFLALKRGCFEKLKSDYNIEEDYILLLDRALENLWHKPRAEYEGREYKKEHLQKLLLGGLNEKVLAFCIHSFEGAKEPIRSPVAYLSKCILGTLISPENAEFYFNQKNAARCESDGADEEKSMSSFDITDFFNAALAKTDRQMKG